MIYSKLAERFPWMELEIAMQEDKLARETAIAKAGPLHSSHTLTKHPSIKRSRDRLTKNPFL